MHSDEQCNNKNGNNDPCRSVVYWKLLTATINLLYANHPIDEIEHSSNPIMRLSLSLVAFGGLLLCQAEQTECQSEKCDARIPETCSMVYAPVPEGGWGVFSLKERSKGTPVWNYGDVVIQVPDASGELQGYIQDFAWNGQETGGNNEGFETVSSLVPGIGMMSRSSLTPNLLPFVPRVDEGGLTRFDFAGAGAITHYHNYTWFVRKPVPVSGELIMDDSLKLFSSTDVITDRGYTASMELLFADGYCMDNLRPGKSKLKEAGRGAFSTRTLPAGSVVAPVPVLPITASSLQMGYQKKHLAEEQLLKNYCLGNRNSTIFLYPYGPIVNLINHFPESNVELRWSKGSEQHLSKSISFENPPHLLMELVATKTIREGEEIFLHYGRAWEEAWFRHKQGWQASDLHYTPSYVMDDAIQMLRTQQEQKGHEYPVNVFTSCFYRYSDRDESEKAEAQSISADKLISFKWKLTKGLYDLKNLRPCQVLRRIEDKKGRSVYAVKMLNRPGLSEEEIIPRNILHIVTHVPRAAIRFSDKPGTSDQHIATAFRHEIGLSDEVFPAAWMNKVKHADTMEMA